MRKLNLAFLKPIVRLALGSLILFVTTSGCSTFGKVVCEGIVEVDGEVFKGSAGHRDEAGLNACNKFCLATDKRFEEMYREWLNSPNGKRLTELKKRQPTKEEALTRDKKSLEYLTINCANRCYKGANKGKHTLKISCKEKRK